MKQPVMRRAGFMMAAVLGVVLVTPGSLLGQQQQDHIISTGQIQRNVIAASAARQNNLRQLDDSLSSPEARRALESAHIDSRQVTNAVGQLNDEELAQLTARAAKAQADFAAGNMSNHDLLLILVGIAALILIIVAVR